MELRIHRVCSAVLLCLSISSVTSQFYSDYSDGGGGGGGGFLQPYDIPVVYKEQNYPPAYPVAPTVYAVSLMKPIEAMPGKKTVPLYIIPEDSLQIGPNKRIKRSHGQYQEGPHHHQEGLRVNIKYPEFYGLTDGYHIPAVEIPLNKPMIVRQIEANVLAPSGFMVPYQGDDREYPFPMNTGCLVGTIPRNTYVSQENPITIRKLYAVPSLPEYPTYRPVSNPHVHLHGVANPPPTNNNDVLANYFNTNNRAPVINVLPHHHHYVKAPKTPQPAVFELVPLTPKSSRRNGKRRNNKRRNQDSDEDDDEDDKDKDDRDSDEDSREDSEDEEDRRRDRNRNRDRDGNKSRNRDRDSRRRQRTTTTTTTTTTTPRTTTTPTTTTTTPRTTTAAASSIQDIIAAFSSYRNRPFEDREREESTRRSSRLSAAFSRDSRDDPTERYRDEERSNSKNSEEPTSSSTSSTDIKELRQYMLQKQISQLQKLLTSLNLSSGPKNEN